jgi:hypothetical protein
MFAGNDKLSPYLPKKMPRFVARVLRWPPNGCLRIESGIAGSAPPEGGCAELWVLSLKNCFPAPDDFGRSGAASILAGKLRTATLSIDCPYDVNLYVSDF